MTQACEFIRELDDKGRALRNAHERSHNVGWRQAIFSGPVVSDTTQSLHSTRDRGCSIVCVTWEGQVVRFRLDGASLFVFARRGRLGELGQAEVQHFDTAFFGRDRGSSLQKSGLVHTRSPVDLCSRIVGYALI